MPPKFLRNGLIAFALALAPAAAAQQAAFDAPRLPRTELRLTAAATAR